MQAFGRERAAADRFGAAVESAFRASLRRISARAVMTAAGHRRWCSAASSAVFWLGVHAGLRGRDDAGARSSSSPSCR